MPVCLCVFVEVASHQKKDTVTQVETLLSLGSVCGVHHICTPKSTFWNVKIGVIETGFRLGWFLGRA